MPTSQWASDATTGFTLVEMLVVLSILGVAAAVLATRMADRPAHLTRERTISELQTRVAQARREAVRSGAPTRLDPSAVDPSAAVEEPVFGDGGTLLFFPDGSSSGGLVSVDSERVLTVDWLTGEAARAQ
jgi:general secretion pathway protein H